MLDRLMVIGGNEGHILNKKIVALVLLAQLLAVTALTLMASVAVAAPVQFGQTTQGPSVAGQPANVMVASRFTAPSNGVATSISAYLINPTGNSGIVRCAIYTESGRTLLAATEQLSVPSGTNGWQTFSLQNGVDIVAGQSYSIVAWFGNTNLQICYSSGTLRQSWYAYQVFGNFPTGPYTSLTIYSQENVVYSLYATVTSEASTPTTSSTPTTPTYSGTFGQTTVGANPSGQPANVMIASRFTATSTASVNSISVYLINPTSNSGIVQCAIYKESDKMLMASTAQTSVPSGINGWQTFAFQTAPTIVSGSTYSIVAWFGNSNLQIRYGTGTTQQSWYAYQSFSAFPTGPYTGFSNYNQENVVYSLYANLGSTSSVSTTPTSTPTPTPTTTPYPTTQYSGNNLAAIPSGWDLSGNGLPQSEWFAHIDYSVLGPSGNPSIRLDPDQAGTERDIFPVDYWQTVKPGDHIIFSIWIKTSSSSLGLNGDSSYGGRIGIDFYDPVNGDQYGINRQYSVPLTRAGSFVPWGTSTWTQFTYDVTVPAGSHINGMIPWIQVLQINDQGQAWFADAQLYINP